MGKVDPKNGKQPKKPKRGRSQRSQKRSELAERVKAIKELLGMFRLERTVYLIVTLISVLVLIVCAIRLVLAEDTDVVALTSLFGGTGGILYTSGRLLKMWSDAVDMISESGAATADTNGDST